MGRHEEFSRGVQWKGRDPRIPEHRSHQPHEAADGISCADYSDLLFTTEMEARTNVHVNWIEGSPVAVTEKVNLAPAGNELPDAFFKCAIDNDLQQRYGEDGVFVPLNDYLETYMPAFNAT